MHSESSDSYTVTAAYSHPDCRCTIVDRGSTFSGELPHLKKFYIKSSHFHWSLNIFLYIKPKSFSVSYRLHFFRIYCCLPSHNRVIVISAYRYLDCIQRMRKHEEVINRNDDIRLRRYGYLRKCNQRNCIASSNSVICDENLLFQICPATMAQYIYRHLEL